MSFPRNVSLKEALEVIRVNVRPLETVPLPLEKALGHALGEDVFADHDMPSFDRAAMDGFALASQDTTSATKDHPVTLTVKNEIHPSTAKPPCVEQGQSSRIMTGGAMPPHADTVVREEDVQYQVGTVVIHSPTPCAQFVIKRGQDVKKGTRIGKKGERIEPAQVGLMAALHVRDVFVTKRPDVAILAIGNELINLHGKPSNPKIVASNLYMLAAMMEKQGFNVGMAKITRNGEEAIRKDVEAGLKKDVVITIGGTAKADSDLTRSVIEAMGVDIAFAGMAMRPGKGTILGFHEKKPVFALPGTPSAVFTVFHTLVLPTLRRLSGLPHREAPTVEAYLEKSIKKKPGVEHVVQGIVSKKESRLQVLPLVGPHVARLTAMTEANGLIRMPPDKGRLVKGQPVTVQLLVDSGSFPFSGHLEHGKSKEPADRFPPVISVVGKSDAGKTTLLERLVPELTARGHRVGTIKHDVHGFDIDHQGKDSWRHKQAGAHTVSISSPNKVAIIKDVDEEETIDRLAMTYFKDVKLILTEGYKKENKPKIEVFRSTVHREPLCKRDDNLIAVMSDTPLDLGVPRFELDDIRGIADFVENRFLRPETR